jgi:hypothetical protein
MMPVPLRAPRRLGLVAIGSDGKPNRVITYMRRATSERYEGGRRPGEPDHHP